MLARPWSHFGTYIAKCAAASRDEATSQAYVQARYQGRGDKADRVFDIHGDYIDRWARKAGGWRIVRRDVRWLMHIGDASVLGPG